MILILLLTSVSTAPCVLWTALPDQDIAAVACPGDVNGNGTDDVTAVAFSGGAGGLWCVDGRTGATLWFSDLPGVSGADCLCGVPDLNGDLVGDVVAGTCDGPSPGRGRILAISGADGTVIWETDSDPDCTIWAVTSSPGPPGELPVIHASVLVDVWLTFLTLDGADGDTLWSITHATLDYGIHTMADFSGTGWGEMGYSVDRGSVTSGFCRVHDGWTGDLLYQTGTMYYGRMDLCDSPAPSIAVGQWGGMSEDLRLLTLPEGTLEYGLDESQVIYSQIRFVREVFGGALPAPVLVGWSGAEMNLICGTAGEVSEEYVYDGSIVEFSACQMSEETWKLVVLTGNTLHLSEPSLYGGSTGESCPLPAAGGDLCLLPSDQYPSPLAAVGLQGAGPGLCAIVTSWPEGIEGEESPSADQWVHLLANPGCGGIHLRIEEGGGRAVVLDITGREVAGIEPGEAGNTFLRLPPGVYLVVDGQNGELLFRAVVTGRQDS